jgi:hypothetical protein
MNRTKIRNAKNLIQANINEMCLSEYKVEIDIMYEEARKTLESIYKDAIERLAKSNEE